MLNPLRSFVNDRRGNFATIVAIAAIPIIGSAALALDFSRASNARSDLQELVDASALAVVNKADGKLSAATGDAEKNLQDFGKDFFRAQNSFDNTIVDIQINSTDGLVTASATYPMTTSLAKTLGLYDWRIAVNAVAQAVGPSASYCMIALNEARNPAITFDGTSDFNAPNCYVHSNGAGSRSMLQKGASTAYAAHFCAAGDVKGRYSPEPVENCDVISDPYAGLKMPSRIGKCDYTDSAFKKGKFEIRPGRYCGGLKVMAHAQVTMEPGVYIFDGGPLELRSKSELVGEEVTLVFVDEGTRLDVAAGSIVDISADPKGDYAGLIFVQDPASSVGVTSTIQGGGEIKIVGTWYFPTQIVRLTGGGEIGLKSEQTAMIADSFVFTGNGATTLDVDFNSDYYAAGFSHGALGIGASARLVR